MPTPEPIQPGPFLNRLVCFLMPYFDVTCAGLDEARDEILETLASYGVRTRSEMLNAAQIIAYGMSALDMLHEAATAELSPAMRLRFRGCANNLNRSGQKNEQTLAKRLACDVPAPTPAEPLDDITEEDLQEQFQRIQAELAAAGIRVPTPSREAVRQQLAPLKPNQPEPPCSSSMMQALTDPPAPPRSAPRP